MTDNNVQLGRSITNAVRFLRKIHQDISELVASLDGAMADRGWHPTETNRVSSTLSNGSDPNRWVLDHLHRCYYYHAGNFESIEDLVTFAIYLDAPTSFDQPLMLGVVARFAVPTRYKTFMQLWTDTEKVFEALVARPGPRQLSADELSTFLPAAIHVYGTAAPLCTLNSTESLITQFIDPLLKVQPTLGH